MKKRESWSSIGRRLKKERKYICEICGYKKYMTAIHCHHIVPLALGGKDEESNAMLLCMNCHTQIHSLMREEQKKHVEVIKLLHEKMLKNGK